MLKMHTRTITKEQYDRAMLNRGYICAEDFDDIFSISEQCGYGIDRAEADTDGGNYITRFMMSDTCD